MKLSKKVLYLFIFSSILLAGSFIHFLFSTREYISWKNRVEKLVQHRRTVLRDQRWTRWRPSADPTRYAILWLFNLDNTCQVKRYETVEVHPGINCMQITLECNGGELLMQEIMKPPFGKVLLRDKRCIGTSKEMELHWYWSKELSPNQPIHTPQDHIVLTLDTIILLDKGWLVKLNNEWIRCDGNRKIKNVEILEVEQYTLQVQVSTPNGKKQVRLKCGDDVRVSYLEC